MAFYGYRFLAALVPQIKFKEKPNTAISLVGLIVCALGCIFIIALPNKSLLLSYILVIVGYPTLMYFTNQIHLSNKFFDWLGSLSFPIYAFQCILRVIEACGLESSTWLFVILAALVLSYSLIMYIVKRKKSPPNIV